MENKLINLFCDFYQCKSIETLNNLLHTLSAEIYNKVRIWFLPVIVYACVKVHHDEAKRFWNMFKLVFPIFNIAIDVSIDPYLCAIEFKNAAMVEYFHSIHYPRKITYGFFKSLLKTTGNDKTLLFTVCDYYKSSKYLLRLSDVLKYVNIEHLYEFMEKYELSLSALNNNIILPEDIKKLNGNLRFKIYMKIAILIPSIKRRSTFHNKDIIDFEIQEYITTDDFAILEFFCDLHISIFSLLTSCYLRSNAVHEGLDIKIKQIYKLELYEMKIIMDHIIYRDMVLLYKKFTLVNSYEFFNFGCFLPVLWTCFNNLSLRCKLLFDLLVISINEKFNLHLIYNIYDLAFMYTVEDNIHLCEDDFMCAWSTIRLGKDEILRLIKVKLNQNPDILFLIPQCKLFDMLLPIYKSKLSTLCYINKLPDIFTINRYSKNTFNSIVNSKKSAKYIMTNYHNLHFPFKLKKIQKIPTGILKNLTFTLFTSDSIQKRFNFKRTFLYEVLKFQMKSNKCYIEYLLLKYFNRKHCTDNIDQLMDVSFEILRGKTNSKCKFSNIISILSSRNIEFDTNLYKNSYLLASLDSITNNTDTKLDYAYIHISDYYIRLLGFLSSTDTSILNLFDAWIHRREYIVPHMIANIINVLEKDSAFFITSFINYNGSEFDSLCLPTAPFIIQHLFIYNPTLNVLLDYVTDSMSDLWMISEIFQFGLNITISADKPGIIINLYNEMKTTISNMKYEEFVTKINYILDTKMPNIFVDFDEKFERELLLSIIDVHFELVQFLFTDYKDHMYIDHLNHIKQLYYSKCVKWTYTSQLYIYLLLALKIEYFTIKFDRLQIKKSILNDLPFPISYDISYRVLDYLRYSDLLTLFSMEMSLC